MPELAYAERLINVRLPATNTKPNFLIIIIRRANVYRFCWADSEEKVKAKSITFRNNS